MPHPSTSLQGQFLLAMPGLNNSFFEKSLIYLFEHNEDGAMGLIVNQPQELSIDEILQQVTPDYCQALYPGKVMNGGPVENNRGFVLHRPGNHNWEGQIPLTANLCVTATNDILEAMAQGANIDICILALGYSGWAPGQLEDELLNNAWLNIDIDEPLIFNTNSENRLALALKQLGIDYQLLSSDAGHA